MSDKMLRNEEILRKAKAGTTLQELCNEYGTTTSNMSQLLNRLGYKKIEINENLKLKEDEKRSKLS